MAGSTLIPSLIYREAEKAMEWLERAFGFEIELLVRDSDGKAAHIEMRHGDAVISVSGDHWYPDTASPVSLGGKTTATVSLQVDDVGAHYKTAKAAGARIVAKPEDQFYGDRVYRAVDLEGHHWSFRQKVRDVPIEEMERATGYKMVTREK